MVIDKDTRSEEVEGILVAKISEILTERREKFLNHLDTHGADHVHHNLTQQYHGVEYSSMKMLDELFPYHTHYFVFKENPRRIEGIIVKTSLKEDILYDQKV